MQPVLEGKLISEIDQLIHQQGIPFKEAVELVISKALNKPVVVKARPLPVVRPSGCVVHQLPHA